MHLINISQKLIRIVKARKFAYDFIALRWCLSDCFFSCLSNCFSICFSLDLSRARRYDDYRVFFILLIIPPFCFCICSKQKKDCWRSPWNMIGFVNFFFAWFVPGIFLRAKDNKYWTITFCFGRCHRQNE